YQNTMMPGRSLQSLGVSLSQYLTFLEVKVWVTRCYSNSTLELQGHPDVIQNTYFVILFFDI
ncbi:28073_t:CDS:2, partial [Racocetra persica]